MGRPGGAGRGALAATLVLGALGALLGALPAAAQPAQPEPTTTTTSPTGESINARMLDDSGKEQRGVEGVRVFVRQDGEEIGEALSDEDGLAVIPVPGPGSYEVRLDPKTIPRGSRLTNPDQVRLPNVLVLEGRPKFVLFPFGADVSEGAGAFDRIVDLAASGLRIGLIVAVAAVGLSLVFGTTGLINFAQGELVTFGALVAFYLNASDGGLGITLVGAAVLALLVAGLFGAGLELGLWRPLRRRRTGNIALLVVSIGLALVLRSIFQIIFGARPEPYEEYAVQEQWHLGPLDIVPKSAVAIGVCAVVLLVVALFLLRTRLGTAVRAVTDNADLAESSGVDVQRVILVAWIACGVLTAIAGVMLGLTVSVEFDMGFDILLAIFAVMIVGGIGSPFGAMLGGVILGLAAEVSTYWIPTDFKSAIYLGVLIVVLLVRPQGILGVRERVG
jgi:branched-chain amino acid transport system permease protein